MCIWFIHEWYIYRNARYETHKDKYINKIKMQIQYLHDCKTPLSVRRPTGLVTDLLKKNYITVWGVTTHTKNFFVSMNTTKQTKVIIRIRFTNLLSCHLYNQPHTPSLETLRCRFSNQDSQHNKRLLRLGYANPGRQIAMATKFCMVAPCFVSSFWTAWFLRFIIDFVENLCTLTFRYYLLCHEGICKVAFLKRL